MAKAKIMIGAVTRTAVGTADARRARRQGKVPAVVYGQGHTPRSVLLDEREWRKVPHDARLLELKMDAGEVLNVMVKETQCNIITRQPTHVDFQEIDLEQIVTTEVQLRPVGTAIGESRGGILEQQAHSIEISCKAKDMPETIEVDISALDIGAAMHVKDIVLPAGIKAVDDPDKSVFHVYVPKIEETTEAAAEAAEGAAEAGEAKAAEGDKAEGDKKAE